SMSDPVRDQRFQKVHNDPRFARNSKRKSKVQIDQRFAAALKDERFQSVQGKYDKYGRRIEKKDNEMKKFYRLEDDEEAEEEEKEEEAKVEAPSTTSSDDDDADATVAKNSEKLSRLDYLNRMARGELASDSDSSDSDDSDDEAEAEVAKEEEEEVPMGEETKRFAVLNCDWTRIRAVDLLALCQSFAPATGAVQNVTIYPSDYGLQMMKEEEQHGPQGLWDKEDKQEGEEEKEADENDEDDTGDEKEDEEKAEKAASDDEDGDSDAEDEENYDSDDPLGVKNSVTIEGESDGFDREKLRKYELQKLRYYYAIVTCDSIKTASTIFDQCDQLEYETSSNVLDLRYVPDDTTFTNTPKESCDSVPDRYKPAIFATLALQQTDVKLTWEEDDEQRLELLTRPTDWKDAHDDDFKAYLASDVSDASEVEADSDSDDEEAGDKADAAPDSKKNAKKEAKIKKLRNRYRSMLLGSDAEDEDDDNVPEGGLGASSDEEDDAGGDMEMSFTPGAGDVLKAKRQKELEANETPFERYTREKKQEKNRKLHEKRTRQKELEREQRDVLKKKGRGSKEANLLREAINGGGDTINGGGDSDDANDSDQDERNFDMKKIAKQEKVKSLKGKRRAKEMKKLSQQKASGGLQEGFEFDAADPRFGALYAKGSQFQLDPTDPKFKKTEATQAIFKERRQRYDQDTASATKAKSATSDSTGTSDNSKHTLNAMVENLKRKSQQQDKKKAKKHKKSKA
ncbi:Pre-rRNA-processing protein ESF1, partial [Phytophthora megakarya]